MTDFDLPPVYNADAGKIIPQSVQVMENQIVSGTSEITKYPSKHWAENVGFELLELNIADAGSGYSIPPQIKISGGGGSGAEARAYIGVSATPTNNTTVIYARTSGQGTGASNTQTLSASDFGTYTCPNTNLHYVSLRVTPESSAQTARHSSIVKLQLMEIGQ